MQRKTIYALGFLGFVLFFYGLLSALFFENVYWYSSFLIGGMLFFGALNSLKKRKSLLTRKQSFLCNLFILYFIAGFITEILGRSIFHWWSYSLPPGWLTFIQIFLVFYPIGALFVYETFIFIRDFIYPLSLAIICTLFFNAFLHEIPNTFVWTWKYSLPYITLEIFKINILAITLGWFIIVGTTLGLEKLARSRFK